MAFSPDGKLLVSASVDGTLRFWDVASATCLAVLYAAGDGWVAFTPEGRCRTAGDLGGGFWHVVNLCRFEPGELDGYGTHRLRDGEPLFTIAAPDVTLALPEPAVAPPASLPPPPPSAWPDVAAGAAAFVAASTGVALASGTPSVAVALGAAVGVSAGVASRVLRGRRRR